MFVVTRGIIDTVLTKRLVERVRDRINQGWKSKNNKGVGCIELLSTRYNSRIQRQLGCEADGGQLHFPWTEGFRRNILKLTITRNLLPVITCAASLAHNKVLCPVETMELVSSEELTSIPAEHLASLVSCVRGRVNISNVSGFNLVTLQYQE